VNICDLADAAFVIEPKSALDFLAILERIPWRKPPKVGGSTLRMAEEDLNGTLNQHNPTGRVAGKKAAETETEE